MISFSHTNQELTPVTYSPAGIKVLHFSIPKYEDCFRIHWHDRMELLRVQRGMMYVVHGANIVEVHEGEILILPPKTPHRAYTIGSGIDYDVLMFDIRSFYNDSTLCRTHLPAVFDGRARFDILTSNRETLQCFDDIVSKWDCDSLEIISYIYRLLHLLFTHSLVELQTEIDKNDLVKNVIAYMGEHLSDDISTASLCARFGYTAAHFCRKFKDETGLTPMTYLKIYRMEKASKLLKKGGLNISEVAAECGYPDSNYFTRCFKAHFGFPPSQLRTQHE